MSDLRLPRILFLPNESGDGLQWGFRGGLRALAERGQISGAHAVSLLRDVRSGGGESARQFVVEMIAEVQPDVVWFQHVAGAGLTPDHYRQWRQAADFVLVYQEADAFDRWRKRLPQEAADAGRAADIVYVSGTGELMSNFTRRGCTDVRWLAQGFDPDTFSVPADAGTTAETDPLDRDFDVVVVANYGSSRVPWRGHPGQKERARAITLLDRHFGERMVLYGSGWELQSAHGRVDYRAQGGAIRGAWVSAIWDFYPMEPRYFSDRLAISLATGGIHFTTLHPGYEDILPLDEGFLHAAATPELMIEAIESFLESTTPPERVELARKGRAFAAEHLSQHVITGQVVTEATALAQSRGASFSAAHGVPLVVEHERLAQGR